MVNPIIKEKIECALEKLPEAEQERIADYVVNLAKAYEKPHLPKRSVGESMRELAADSDREAASELSTILREEDERQWAMLNWAKANGI
jgi:hypothetical protein